MPPRPGTPPVSSSIAALPPASSSLPVAAQVLGDRQHVDRLALVVQREHRLVDRPVAVAVEVLGLEALLDDEPVHRAVRQQDAAEHRLLGLERVRRRDARGDLGGRARRGVGVRAHGVSSLCRPGRVGPGATKGPAPCADFRLRTNPGNTYNVRMALGRAGRARRECRLDPVYRGQLDTQGCLRLVRPAAVRVVEVARGVLLVAVAVAATGVPGQCRDRSEAADDADDAPDRVRDPCEQSYFFSTTIVFTEAVTPSATSTTTTYVPTFLIGSSRWILRRSTFTPRASSIASAMS